MRFLILRVRRTWSARQQAAAQHWADQHLTRTRAANWR